jgi:hypothetical protein
MNAQRTQQVFRLACIAMLGLTLPRTADAHRLDEYLQASRISIEPGRIAVELNLTPGAAVAEGVIAEIDRDGDGELSPAEGAAYAGDVVRSLSLEVDGVQWPLALERYQVALPAEMRQGLGTIRLYAVAQAPLVVGSHRLVFRNTHRADIGVYLVNALVPPDDRIRIHGQSRDFLQREYTVEYALASPPKAARAASVSSAVAITLAALCFVFFRGAVGNRGQATWFLFSGEQKSRR